MMNEPVGGGGGGGGGGGPAGQGLPDMPLPHVIQVTPQEREAIERVSEVMPETVCQRLLVLLNFGLPYCAERSCCTNSALT